MAEENVSVPARIDIAWVFLLLGETNQAISMLEKLAIRASAISRSAEFVGIAYLKKGRQRNPNNEKAHCRH